MSLRCWTPAATFSVGYGRSRWGLDGALESSAASMKWYGVVADDSKYRPSIESMHPSVQYGRSIRAMGVPKRSRFASYSQWARPHPLVRPTWAMVLMMAEYSGYASLRS